MNIELFWKAILEQDAQKIKEFFNPSACINWHNTNEKFTLDEFIVANCEYPGEWDGLIERIEIKENLIITAVKVFSKDKTQSYHVVSFIKIKDDKIIQLDEYWGNDGEIPKWRVDKKIGEKIK